MPTPTSSNETNLFPESASSLPLKPHDAVNAFTAYIPGSACGQDYKINMLSVACSLVHVDPAYKHLTGKSGRAKSSEVE